MNYNNWYIKNNIYCKAKNAPIGVATYRLQNILAENVKAMLPEHEEK